MSEFTTNPNLPPTDALKVQDDRVTELLANPEIRQGQRAVEAAIAEYYQGLEASGKHIELLAKGVTADGDCIVAVKVGEAQQPIASEPQSNAKPAGEHYSVFTYHLSQVAEPGFVEGLSPRVPGDVVNAACCSKCLYLERPGQKITLSYQAIREQRGVIDKELYKKLRQQHNQQIKGADRLILGDAHHPRVLYNGQPIISLEDAAFGKRRQAAVDKAIAPLVAERKLHYGLGFGALDGTPQAAVEIAKARALTDRIEAIIKVMRDNPDVVDDPGELVLDPMLAEQMAYKARANTWKARGRRLLGLFRPNA